MLPGQDYCWWKWDSRAVSSAARCVQVSERVRLFDIEYRGLIALRRSTDPGILVDLNKYTGNPQDYQPPGPAVWRG